MEPTLINVAFRSREVEKLLNALDPHGGTDPIGMLPLFLKETSRVLAPKLSTVFSFVGGSLTSPQSPKGLLRRTFPTIDRFLSHQYFPKFLST